MDKSIKGTKTEKNLLLAFAGESQARSRYTYFAKQAKKEGFEQIAAIFTETAEQELSHAKQFFKHLEGGEAEITTSFSGIAMGNTAENLKVAAEGELDEWTTLYPEFSRIAAEEGFTAIAVAFKVIANAERVHEERFRKLLVRLENDTLFEREESVKWFCRKCGYVHEGKRPPKNCPACSHPQGYFEEMAENY